MIEVPKVKPIETDKIPSDVRDAQYRLVKFALDNGAFTLHFQLKDVKADDFSLGDWEIMVRRVT